MFDRLRNGWRDLSLARKSALAVFLPIEALLVGFVLLYFASNAERAAQRAVAHTLEVRYQLRAILTTALTAESSLQEFVISGGDDLLRAYETAAGSLPTLVENVAARLADNPKQLARVRELQSLVEEKLAVMSALRASVDVASATSGNEKGALVVRSRDLMQHVRAKLEAMDADEAEMQEQHVARVERVRDLTVATYALTVGLGLVGGIAGVVLLSRSVVRRLGAIAENADRLARDLPLVPLTFGTDEICEVGRRIASASELLASKSVALRDEKQHLQRKVVEFERVEAALRESEARLQAILDQTHAVVYVKDLEGRFQLVNRTFEAIVGADRDQIRGRTCLDLFGEEVGAPLLDHDQQVLRSGVPHEFEEVIRLDSRDHVYLSLKFPLLDHKGRPYAICGISSDITERKASEHALRVSHEELEARVRERTAQLEETNALLRREISQHLQTAKALKETQEQYLHAQKMEALGLLAGGVAHDFNNILTAIMGYGTVLLEELPDDRREGSHIAEILRAAERAAGLSKQLLGFSRRQTYQPRVLDLSTVVREVEKMLRQVIGERVVLETHLAEDIGCVRADAGHVEQMLLNLVVNARDAMPGDGTIVISTCEVTLAADDVKNASATREFIALSVRDNGTGIPPEVKARIFEPFFTTKRAGQGTGLGLATCSAIAQQSGGWLDCESTVGVGTEFTFYLPRVHDRADATETGSETRNLPSGSEAILVVEDEPVVGDIVSLLLANLGYDVIRAENGEEAELAVATRGAGAISLVLTDLNMPRMDGRELVDRLARENPEIKVLLTSGNDDLLDEERAAELQVDFLPKPFTLQMLAAKVRAVLDS